MPTSDTITAFNTFAPRTIIESDKMNVNFGIYRGHIIPVDGSLAAAANASYDLGSTTYRWRNIFLSDGMSVLPTTTSATPSSGYKLYNKSGVLVARDSSGVDLRVGPGMAWKKHSVSFGAMAIAGLTQTGTLFNAEPREIIHGYFAKHSTSFTSTNASITALTIKLGLSGSIDKYVPSLDIITNVTTTGYYSAQDFDMPGFAATTSVQWTVEAVGGNLNVLTAGQVEIWVLTSILP